MNNDREIKVSLSAEELFEQNVKVAFAVIQDHQEIIGVAKTRWAMDYDDLAQELQMVIFKCCSRFVNNKREEYDPNGLTSYCWHACEARLYELARKDTKAPALVPLPAPSRKEDERGEDEVLSSMQRSAAAKNRDFSPDTLVLVHDAREKLDGVNLYCFDRLVAGDTQSDIAQSLGVSRNAVSARMKKIRRNLHALHDGLKESL